MRADRLVSLVLLLRQRGRMTAAALSRELEVSTRTVLRDIEALSAAGVPVYADRGRYGGFSLLPGFRTELTGLNQDEAVALITAGSRGNGRALGLEPALASALRKVVDALPEGHRSVVDDASRRLLVDPETDLFSRRLPVQSTDGGLPEVRRAVVTGRRLRIRYTAAGGEPHWRTVDPIGLVTVRDRGYLLAMRAGQDRTYRLSRISAAEVLDEAAERPSGVDLDQVWRERCRRFLADGHVAVQVRVIATRREDLLETAEAVRAEETGGDGWLRLELTFQDLWHAEWAPWRLGEAAEALGPPELRRALHRRAVAVTEQYQDAGSANARPPAGS